LFVSKFLSRPISIEGGVIVDGTCITLDEEHAKLLLQFLVDYKKKEKEATENAAWKTILKS
jgi:cytoskeletal protein CcmA (bactofilin family)